jgi:hypothetical protein
MRRGVLQGAAVVAAILVIASGTKSFSSQRAGFGIETSSGYQVSNVKYWLGGDSEVRSVNFDLDAPAHAVTARLQAAGGWYVCRSTGSASWSCVVPESAAVGINDADMFQVRAH